MRQVALAQVLFQMGCYVPAESARVGPCDRLFTRIGSGDFLLRGQSTFMVEMLETAHILRNATPASLVLVDELGRGTSTFDGLSLAWSILEDLHDRVGARTLFSTHYHEILAVTEGRLGVVPMQMEVVEDQASIVFSRRFKPGAAGKSYGLHVAERAGLPDALLQRSAIVLDHLNGARTREADLPPVATVTPAAATVAVASESGVALTEANFEARFETHPAVVALRDMNPDNMSPREALEFVFELRDAVASGATPRGWRKSSRAGGGAREGDSTLF